MNSKEENKQKTNDSPMIQKVVMELTNTVEFMRPTYNSMLKARCKAQMIRSSLADQCVPVLLALKEANTNECFNSSKIKQELRAAINECDRSLYEKPLLEFEAKYNIPHKKSDIK